MITSWIATITFFSTRGRCFTKAIAHSKAIETDIILSIVEIKKTNFYYRKVMSYNTSRLEAHAAFFRLLMKGIFSPYVL